MRVLFLDIDGVLNSGRTAVAFGGYPAQFTDMDAFDHVAIALIRAVCKGGDIKVVLSSYWRLSYSAEAAAEALRLPIIDRTPSLDSIRGVEINAWLSEHPEVTAYAIVDDDDDMMPQQRERFVRTDEREGLTWTDYARLCALFSIDQLAGQPQQREWRDKPLWM